MPPENLRTWPDWHQVAGLVLTSRFIDEIQEQELAPTGKIPYQFSAKGHELAQVLLGLALTNPKDAAGVYYRSRPFMLACGMAPAEAFAADMARTGSPSEGRDVGVVYSMASRGGATVLPASGDVGAQYTPSAGWAQAIRYYADYLEDSAWQGAIAVAMGGDGSVASNGFWAALTIATTLQLPLLFFIEDNGYGISVPRHFQTPGGDIAANLESFLNLHLLSGSGTVPLETASLVREAVDHVRMGTGPCLLRLEVPRLTGHTFGEDQAAYKSEEQLEHEKRQDPLRCLRDFMESEVDWESLASQVKEEVQAGLAAALNQPEPASGSADRNLFFEGVWPQVPSGTDRPGLEKGDLASPSIKGPRINFVDAIRRVMESELAINDRLVVFGEDVGLRGGVHRATLDLQKKYGEMRVFDTSLSEEGIIGRATGMALAGLTPLPEIQFRKYADPAHEQIQDAGWVRWRTAGKFGVHMVVRIPVGHSKRTGDPWHSLSAEAVYAHTLGWKIAYPSNAADAAGLLRAALRGQDPVLFLEHRALLDTPAGRRPYPGDGYSLPFGIAERVREGRWLTVVSWGEMLHRCMEAADSFADEVELIDLRTLIPWDKSLVLESVRKTGKILVAHEDSITAGFGAEIIAAVVAESFDSLDAPPFRVATSDVPIPYNVGLMNQVIPDVEAIRKSFERLLNW